MVSVLVAVQLGVGVSKFKRFLFYITAFVKKLALLTLKAGAGTLSAGWYRRPWENPWLLMA